MTLSEIREAYDNHVKTGCMISPAEWAEMVGELLPMVRSWTPVSERLPEAKTWNLVCYEGPRMPIGNMSHWFDGKRFHDISSWPVTHWMPTPDYPSMTKRGSHEQ